MQFRVFIEGLLNHSTSSSDSMWMTGSEGKVDGPARQVDKTWAAARVASSPMEAETGVDDTVFTVLDTFPGFKEVAVSAAAIAVLVGQLTLFGFCWFSIFPVCHRECVDQRNEMKQV